LLTPAPWATRNNGARTTAWTPRPWRGRDVPTPKELRPIQHRSSARRLDLSVIRARDCLVRSRTLVLSTVRSLIKTHGKRLPSCSSPAFAKKAGPLIPENLQPALNPLLETIASFTLKISQYDKYIKELSEKKYPQTARRTQVQGVSFLTALAYVLTLEDSRRFANSRSAGAFVGLVPALDDSGHGTPQLRISRAGNGYLRRLTGQRGALHPRALW